MKINKKQIRRIISESINELTLVKSGNPPTPKVVDMEVNYPDENGRQGAPMFIFRHEELPYGIMRAIMDQAGEALNSLVQMGFTQISIGGPLPYDTLIDDESQSGRFDDFGYEY